MASTLTILGLLSNLLGVLLLFRFALPFANRTDDKPKLIVGDDAEARKRLQLYEGLSRLGIFFVVLGTILQAVPLLCRCVPAS